jgi:broad specificity phosphatase PhoE
MKQVFVIRHADKNLETGELTDEGRARARKLQATLGKFDLVITADRPRLTETALLLSGETPILDERAGFVYTSLEQREQLKAKAKVSSSALVIFAFPEFQELASTIGTNLIELIKATLEKLPTDGKALIVSQDGVMTAAERILHNQPYEKIEASYQPLEGFLFNEALVFEAFTV